MANSLGTLQKRQPDLQQPVHNNSEPFPKENLPVVLLCYRLGCAYETAVNKVIIDVIFQQFGGTSAVLFAPGITLLCVTGKLCYSFRHAECMVVMILISILINGFPSSIYMQGNRNSILPPVSMRSDPNSPACSWILIFNPLHLITWHIALKKYSLSPGSGTLHLFYC